MQTKSRRPVLISHIHTISGKEYIIVQYRTRGYEKVRYYTVHLCDVKAGILHRTPILEIVLPYEQRHRYRHYYRDFLGILSYALTTEKIIPGIFPAIKRLRVSFELLDRWHRNLMRDYQSRTFDAQSIAYPEL